MLDMWGRKVAVMAPDMEWGYQGYVDPHEDASLVLLSFLAIHKLEQALAGGACSKSRQEEHASKLSQSLHNDPFLGPAAAGGSDSSDSIDATGKSIVSPRTPKAAQKYNRP